MSPLSIQEAFPPCSVPSSKWAALVWLPMTAVSSLLFKIITQSNGFYQYICICMYVCICIYNTIILTITMPFHWSSSSLQNSSPSDIYMYAQLWEKTRNDLLYESHVRVSISMYKFLASILVTPENISLSSFSLECTVLPFMLTVYLISSTQDRSYGIVTPWSCLYGDTGAPAHLYLHILVSFWVRHCVLKKVLWDVQGEKD